MQTIDKTRIIPENILTPILLLSFTDIIKEIVLNINIMVHIIESILLNISVLITSIQLIIG